jgi:threonine aldolase
MFCLSKGLGAPVGSVLCGKAEFIQRARKTRKMLGGGMRQAGIIAAAGTYALEHHLPKLKEDHHRAKNLAAKLGDLAGVSLEIDPPPTNMVYLNLDPEVPADAQQISDKLREMGILVGITADRQFRLVTHLWITDKDVNLVVEAFRVVLA